MSNYNDVVNSCENQEYLMIIRKKELEYQYQIQATKGSVHDYSTCEGCQSSLESLARDLEIRLAGYGEKKPFPECCELHKNLLNLDKDDSTDK